MTRPLTQNIPTYLTSHVHSLGNTLTLSLANFSSYSVSCTCSRSHSPTVTEYFLSPWHTSTTPLSTLTNLLWMSRSHSPILADLMVALIHVRTFELMFVRFATTIWVLQIRVTRDVYMIRFHFLHRIPLPLSNYAGCIHLNTVVKCIKMTYNYEQWLEFIYGCSRKI